MSAAKKLVNSKSLDIASSLLRALAHPLRMKLITYIDTHRKINVNKIYKPLKLEQSIASQHLRILRDAGLVRADRDGKFIFYQVNYHKIEQVSRALHRFFTATA